jgi:kynureninase
MSRLPMREAFLLPTGIYLDGNSLGPASLAAHAALERRFRQWQHRAVEGWEEWFGLAERLAPALGRLVGAHPDEVVPTGGITVNLHALLAGFYRPEGRRRTIVALAREFPSDLYALRSWTERMGGELRLVGGPDEVVDEAEVEAALDETVALAWLPVVGYRSGQRFDVARLTRAAHAVGTLAGWDAAHSVGALPHAFHDDGVDLAVWCSYKYLNAGPGAPGGLFVHRRHHDRAPGLPGWWGHAKDSQFAMRPDFTAAEGAGGWQIGTPSILALAGLEGALALFEEVGIEEVRARSLELTERLMTALDRSVPELAIVTPRTPRRRGGHVAVRHPDAARLSRALRARGVVPDHRPPDLLRLAPVAFYTLDAEIDRVVEVLRELLDGGLEVAEDGAAASRVP